MSVITISSSYGAMGATIGRSVAESLGFSFFDRAIPTAVAHQLAIDAEEVTAYDERPPKRIDRMLSAIANSIIPIGSEPSVVDSPNRVKEGTERVLKAIADGDGGVILGRAGMVVLRDRKDVLRVRLDGPVEARIAQVVRIQGLDAEAVRSEQRETDGAREAYSQLFYGVSQGDASLYHLVIDSTLLSHETCVEFIVRAAKESFALQL